MSRASNLAGFVSAIYPSDNLNVGILTARNLNVTGVSTFESLDITGTVIITGGVSYAEVAGIATYATTAGIATYATTAGIATSAEGLETSRTIGLSGDATGSGSFDGTGDLTIAVDVNTSTYAQGLSGTPDIAVRNVVGAAATFSGDVSIGGTITYEDVTSIDSVGVITARQGIDVTGIVTASIGFDGPQYIYESADLNQWYNIPMMAQSTAGGQYSNLMVDNGGIQFNPSFNEFYIGNNIRANGNTGIITASRVDSTFVNPSRLSVSLGSWLEGYKFEEGNINTSTSLTGTFDYNILNGHVQTWSSATSGNYGPNFIINGSTINAFTDVGDVMTANLMVASSSHYLAGANIQIDGSSANLDIDYVGGSAPSAANGSGYDIYSFTIQKTAATPAYLIIVNALGAN